MRRPIVETVTAALGRVYLRGGRYPTRLLRKYYAACRRLQAPAFDRLKVRRQRMYEREFLAAHEALVQNGRSRRPGHGMTLQTMPRVKASPFLSLLVGVR